MSHAEDALGEQFCEHLLQLSSNPASLLQTTDGLEIINIICLFYLFIYYSFY